MPTAKATKASDKAQICRKLVLALQKLYGKSVPKVDLPVLETFLLAICLEDNSWEAAETGLKKLQSSCFDLNEVRVSSVTELEQLLQPLKNADWKGLRIRSLLRYVFESSYSFDFEKFRRLTQEVAVKTLKKVNDLSPFVRDFALQHILGSHIVCLDESMLLAARWLGLVPADLDATAAGEFLKGGLKKSEVAEFCHLLRCLATDRRFVDRFQEPLPEGLDMEQVLDRLAEVQQPSKRKPVKAADKPAEVPAAKDKTATVKGGTAGVQSKPAADKGDTRSAAKKAPAPSAAKPSSGTKAAPPARPTAPAAAPPKTKANVRPEPAKKPAPAKPVAARPAAKVDPKKAPKKK